MLSPERLSHSSKVTEPGFEPALSSSHAVLDRDSSCELGAHTDRGVQRRTDGGCARAPSPVAVARRGDKGPAEAGRGPAGPRRCRGAGRAL